MDFQDTTASHIELCYFRIFTSLRFVSRQSSLSGRHVHYTQWVPRTPGWLWTVLPCQPGWPRWTGRLFSQLFAGLRSWVSRALLQDGVTSRAGALSCWPGSLCASFGPKKTPRSRAPSKEEDCGRCEDHVSETDWTEGLLPGHVLGRQTEVGYDFRGISHVIYPHVTPT